MNLQNRLKKLEGQLIKEDVGESGQHFDLSVLTNDQLSRMETLMSKGTENKTVKFDSGKLSNDELAELIELNELVRA